MNETIHNSLINHFYNNSDIELLLPQYEKKIVEDKISSFAAAQILLDNYFKKHN